MITFDVTYEIVTHESAEHGDAEERGFAAKGVRLREAISEIGHCAHQADCSPIAGARWYTNCEYDEDFRTGARESRSLHMPNSLTEASRMRIARLLGVR